MGKFEKVNQHSGLIKSLNISFANLYKSSFFACILFEEAKRCNLGLSEVQRVERSICAISNLACSMERALSEQSWKMTNLNRTSSGWNGQFTYFLYQLEARIGQIDREIFNINDINCKHIQRKQKLLLPAPKASNFSDGMSTNSTNTYNSGRTMGKDPFISIQTNSSAPGKSGPINVSSEYQTKISNTGSNYSAVTQAPEKHIKVAAVKSPKNLEELQSMAKSETINDENNSKEGGIREGKKRKLSASGSHGSMSNVTEELQNRGPLSWTGIDRLYSKGKRNLFQRQGDLREVAVTSNVRLQNYFVSSGCQKLSRNGKLVCGGDNGSITIWDAETGEIIAVPKRGHSGRVTCVSISDDGERVISASTDKSIIVWDATTGEVVWEPQKLETSVWDMDCSENGERVVVKGLKGNVHVLELRSRSRFGTSSKSPLSSTEVLAISRDGKFVKLVESYGQVLIWDVEKQVKVWGPVKGHRGHITCLAFSIDGRLSVSAGEDGVVRIWNARTGKMIGTPVDGHYGRVDCTAFSNDSKKIVSVCRDGQLLIWNVETRCSTIAVQWNSPGRPCETVADVIFSNGDKRVMYSKENGEVSTLNIENGETVSVNLVGYMAQAMPIFFSGDRKQISSFKVDGTIQVWDVDSGRNTIMDLKGHCDQIHFAVFSSLTKRVVIVSKGGSLLIWDGGRRELERRTMINSKSISCIALSGNGKRLAIGDLEGSVLIRDLDIEEETGMKLKGVGSPVDCLAFSNHGNRVACARKDGEICVWNADTGERVGAPSKESTAVKMCIVFSDDGTKLVYAADCGKLNIWNELTGEVFCVKKIMNFACFDAIALSSDTRQVAATSGGRICFFDSSMRTIVEYRSSAYRKILGLSFSVDGKKCFSVGDDGCVKAWDIDMMKAHTNEGTAYSIAKNHVCASSALDFDGSFQRLIVELTEEQGADISGSDMGFFNSCQGATQFCHGRCDLQMRMHGICVEFPKGTKMPNISPTTWVFSYGSKQRQVMVQPHLLTPLGLSVLSWILLPRENTMASLIWCMNLAPFKNCVVHFVTRSFQDLIANLRKGFGWMNNPDELEGRTSTKEADRNNFIVIPRGWLYWLGISEDFVSEHGYFGDFATKVGILSSTEQLRGKRLGEGNFLQHLRTRNKTESVQGDVECQAVDICARPINGGTEYLYLNHLYKLTYLKVMKGSNYTNGFLGMTMPGGAGFQVGISREMAPNYIDPTMERYQGFPLIFRSLTHFVSHGLIGSSQRSLVQRMNWLRVAFDEKATFPLGTNQNFLEYVTRHAKHYERVAIFENKDCTVRCEHLKMPWHYNKIREYWDDLGGHIFFIVEYPKKIIYKASCCFREPNCLELTSPLQVESVIPEEARPIARDLV